MTFLVSSVAKAEKKTAQGYSSESGKVKFHRDVNVFPCKSNMKTKSVNSTKESSDG